jgi:hypothetical protein
MREAVIKVQEGKKNQAKKGESSVPSSFFPQLVLMFSFVFIPSKTRFIMFRESRCPRSGCWEELLSLTEDPEVLRTRLSVVNRGTERSETNLVSILCGERR